MADSEFKRLLQLWHGSPYDWERPDPAKAGAGEGTKAMGGYGIYGHGTLYAAEQQDIGKWYLEQTSKKRRRDASGAGYQIKGAGHRDFGNLIRELEDRERAVMQVNLIQNGIDALGDQKNDPVFQMNHDSLRSAKNNLKTHDLVINQLIERPGLGEFKDLLKSLDHHDIAHLDDVHHSMTWDGFKGNDAVDALDESIKHHVNRAPALPEVYANYGDPFERQRRLEPLVKEMKRAKSNIKPRLYELQVHLDDHEILDWDKQLEEHHPEAAKKILSVPAINKHVTPPKGDPDFEADFGLDDWMNNRKVHPDYSEGADVYKWLADELGGAPKATEALMDAGIKGIRYEDNSSRDRRPVLHHKGKVINDNGVGETEDPAINAYRYAIDMSRTSRPVASPDELAMRIRERAASEKDHNYKRIWSKAAEWVEDNLRDLDIRPPPPSYNYVIFDPDRIDVVRKFDESGNKVYEKK